MEEQFPGSDAVGLDNFDTRVLSDFIIQLNISRRHFASYPRNHPMVGGSARKAQEHLRRLLVTADELAIGVTGRTLLVGDAPLDRQNPVFADLAQALFDRGIAVIRFSAATSEDEIHLLNDLLSRPRDPARAPAGIEQEMIEAGLRHIRVTGVHYDGFRVTGTGESAPSAESQEQDADSLWGGFVRGLMRGVLDPEGEQSGLPAALSPERIAEILNARLADEPGQEENYEAVIASFLRTLETGRNETGDTARKFHDLVDRLNPDLRRQFLRSALKEIPSRQQAADKLWAGPAGESLIAALAEVNADETEVAEPVLEMIQKLAGAQGSLGGSGRVAGGEEGAGKDDLERWKTLLGQKEGADSAPESRRTLMSALAAGDLSPASDPEAEALRQTLTDQSLQTQFCNVLLQVMQTLGTGEDEEAEAASARNLCELCGYFLGIGDFAFLTAIHARLRSLGAQPAAREVMAVFAADDFVQSVLAAPALWGKSRFPEIRRLIREVGPSLVEPLLDRLAEEPNLFVRRFFIEALGDLGEAVRIPAVARLTDGRWHVVRNLVVILRGLGDPEVLRPIRRLLLTHTHVRVRQEVLRTLLHFGAPEAELLLVEEMACKEHDRQLTAIQMAEKCPSGEVIERLVQMLNRRSNLQLRIAAVRSLAGIGDPKALPAVERLLLAKGYFFAKIDAQLKIEAARSLGRYPADAAAAVIKRLQDAGLANLARLAAAEKRGEAESP